MLLGSVEWSGTVSLGTTIAVAILLIFGIIAQIRSGGAKTWRENAEAEKARADRLVEEKAQLVLDKAAADAKWTARVASLDSKHAEELRALTDRIHILEVDLAKLQARPTVDDLASAVGIVQTSLDKLHLDYAEQTGVLTTIRDTLVARAPIEGATT